MAKSRYRILDASYTCGHFFKRLKVFEDDSGVCRRCGVGTIVYYRRNCRNCRQPTELSPEDARVIYCPRCRKTLVGDPTAKLTREVRKMDETAFASTMARPEDALKPWINNPFYQKGDDDGDDLKALGLIALNYEESVRDILRRIIPN